jgi:dTDP-4-amino-4,6-dideoxygalactose transaminase
MDFIDLKTQQKLIRKKIDERISNVLNHGQYIQGPEIKELENKLSIFSKSKFVLCCSSGTDALLLGLIALGLKPKDAVIVPSFTFASTAEAVCMLGGIPFFSDVKLDTFNICEKSISKCIEKSKKLGISIKGIITVGLFGQPCDMKKIKEVANANKLWVFDDAAQSFGAIYNDNISGNLCEISATSFFPAKPLGCYGDGGALFTNDENLYKVAYSCHLHGMGSDKYKYERIGLNGRIDTIQAAILLEKLKIFKSEIIKRNKIAENYKKIFKTLNTNIKLPKVLPKTRSTWAQFTIQLPEGCNRDELQVKMKDKNIPTAIYYPIPIHCQIPYKSFPTSSDNLKKTNILSNNVISLPMHPYLTTKNIEYIAQSLHDILYDYK